MTNARETLLRLSVMLQQCNLKIVHTPRKNIFCGYLSRRDLEKPKTEEPPELDLNAHDDVFSIDICDEPNSDESPAVTHREYKM